MRTLIILLLITVTATTFAQTRNPIVERQRAYQAWLRKDMVEHPEKYRAPQQPTVAPATNAPALAPMAPQPVPIPQRLRIVDGKLYDSNRSVLWTNLTAKYVQAGTNGLTIMQADDSQIMVRNFSIPKLMPGTKVPLRVLPVGETNWNGQVIGLYDCGTLPKK